MQIQMRTAVFALATLSLVACQEDLTAEKKTWEETTAGWQGKLDKLAKDHAALTEKAKGLVAPAADAAVAGEKSAADAAVSAAAAGLEAVKQGITSARTAVDASITAGKKVGLQAAISSAKAPVDGLLSKAESLISAADGAVTAVGQKISAIDSAAAATKAAADKLFADSKTKGAVITWNDIAFTADAALDLEKSKDGLNSLVSVLKGTGIKADIFVDAAVKDTSVGTKRALALKAYLAANGVPATALGLVAGRSRPELTEGVVLTVVNPAQ